MGMGTVGIEGESEEEFPVWGFRHQLSQMVLRVGYDELRFRYIHCSSELDGVVSERSWVLELYVHTIRLLQGRQKET